ncbi:MAG: carboxypeptidase regulatory-like domain-containing protein [Planctomycetes bacterium]|nr:carboxypeptidase regulatory-like domain-containing protein [Planctomycetota bacterium]
MGSRRRNLLGLLLLVASVGSLVWFLQGEAAPRREPRKLAHELPLGARERGAEVVAAQVTRRAEEPSSESAAPAANAMLDTEPPYRRCVLARGRLVRSEDGSPLAGARVEAIALSCHQSDGVIWEGDHSAYPVSIESDAEGRFEYRDFVNGEAIFDLRFLARGRTVRELHKVRAPLGETAELGDLALAWGAIVRGRIVDAEGRPFPEFEEEHALELSRVWSRFEVQHFRKHRAQSYATDTEVSAIDFEFTFEVGFPPGTWPLELHSEGWQLLGPDRVEVRAGEPVPPLELRVAPTACVEGRLLYEDGKPIHSITTVEALREDGVCVGRTWVRSNEEFTLFAEPGAPAVVRVRARGPAGHEVLPETQDQRASWGQRDLLFRLRRARSLVLSIVERGTGAPVSSAVTVCYQAEQETHAVELSVRCEKDGHEIEGVRSGRGRLLVVPADDHLMPSAPLSIEIGMGEIEALRVELERKSEQRVRVLDVEGRPIPGALVQAIHRGTSWIENRSAAEWFSLELLRLLDPAASFTVAAARTDGDGSAELLLPADLSSISLRATCTGFETKLRGELARSEAPLELVLERGVALRGRWIAPGWDFERLRFRLEAAEPADSLPQIALSAQGEFAVDGLRPGRYVAHLKWWNDYRFGPQREEGFVALAEERVELELDAPRELALDASRSAPGFVRARATLDGTAPASAYLRWRNEHGTCFGAYALDAQGAAGEVALPPGRYRAELLLSRPHEHPSRVVLAAAETQIAPDEQREVTLAFRSRG